MGDPETNLKPEAQTPTTRSWSSAVYWISAALLLAGILIIPLDSWLAHPEHVKHVPGDLRKFVGLSEIFAHGFGVLVIVSVLWLMVPGATRFIPRIAVCAFWPSILVHVIKLHFARWRPIRFFDAYSVARFPADQTDTWLGWMPYGKFNLVYATQSFPSAHAATTWGLAIGLAWAFPRGRWLFFSIAVLASLQRILSFAHWPSDVLIGASIAFCFAGALTQNWGLGKILGRLEAYWDRSQSRTVAGTAGVSGPTDSVELLPELLPGLQTEVIGPVRQSDA